MVELICTFLVSVGASVVAYYICKWLDYPLFFLKKKEELSDWVSSSYVAFNLYFCLLELYHELLKSKRPRLSVG